MTLLTLPLRQGDRLTLLIQASNRLLDEERNGSDDQHYGLTDDLVALRSAFETALQTLQTRRSAKARLILLRAVRVEALARVLRDFRAVTLRRAKREPHGELLRDLFETDNRFPSASPGFAMRWFHTAQQYVAAEAQARAKGFAPSGSPSIEELSALMEGSEQLFSDTDEACFLLKEAEMELADLSEEAMAKLRLLGAYLRTRFRKFSRSELRVVMGTYGFTFTSKESGDAEGSPDGVLRSDPSVLVPTPAGCSPLPV